MLTKPVEDVDHEGPCVDNLLEARPLADETERVFACPNQRPAAEALEAGIQAAGTHLMVDQSGVSRLGSNIHIWRKWS